MQTRHGESQGSEQASCIREINDSSKEKVNYLIEIVRITFNVSNYCVVVVVLCIVHCWIRI